MASISDSELNAAVSSSLLVKKYGEEIDRESAYEMLTAKLHQASTNAGTPSQAQAAQRPGKSTFEKVISDPITRQIGRTVAREVTRGLLGVLGLSGGSRSRRGGLF